MTKRTVRSILVILLALFAMITPSKEAAAATTAACGFPSPFHDCTDTSALRYMCNYMCPNWTWAICYEDTLTCYSEPD